MQKKQQQVKHISNYPCVTGYLHISQSVLGSPPFSNASMIQWPSRGRQLASRVHESYLRILHIFTVSGQNNFGGFSFCFFLYFSNLKVDGNKK
jgi:hypothetical protein